MPPRVFGRPERALCKCRRLSVEERALQVPEVCGDLIASSLHLVDGGRHLMLADLSAISLPGAPGKRWEAPGVESGSFYR